VLERLKIMKVVREVENNRRKIINNNRNITRKGSKDNGNKVDRHSKEYSFGLTTDQPVEGRFERTS
jgi:hypothetical protein